MKAERNKIMDRKEQELELYVHIPFCVRKCGYCDFLSGTAEESTREAYLLALAGEIRRAGQDAEGCRAGQRVFSGAETPTVLTGGQLSRLLSEIKKSFRLAGDCEITLEANPGTLDPEKLRLCREAGFNRISIGCQVRGQPGTAQAGTYPHMGGVSGRVPAGKGSRLFQH